MKNIALYELVGSIREEFILEAEPKRLAAILAGTPEKPLTGKGAAAPRGGLYVIPTREGKTAGRRPTPAKRWMTAACLALAILLVGGGAGMGTLLTWGGMSQGGENVITSLFGPNFLPSLFPFLYPDETEPSDDTSDTEDPCAEGHDWEISDSLEPVCYTEGYTERTCKRCGMTETEYSTIQPHVYENGACRTCGLIEGAAEDCLFRMDNALLATTGEKGAVLIRVNGDVEGELILPNVGYVKDQGILPVTGVGAGVLNSTPNKPAITRVVFPDTVREIYELAFNGIPTLTEVVWPAALEEIKHDAFVGTALTSLSLPEGVRVIGDKAFAGCTALTSVTLPASLETLGSEAFMGCTALTELDLSHGGYTMGNGIFSDCTALETVVIPAGVTVLGESVFARCTALRNVTLPDTLTNTGKNTFSGCVSLASITLPDGIDVDDGCFADCTALTALTLPANMGSIGYNAFNRSGLTELTVTGNIRSIDSGAFGNTGLTSLVIPGYLGSVGDAFTNTPLRELVVLGISPLQGGVGYEAFKNHPTLERVILPDGMTSINSSAFEGCAKLTEVRLPDSIEYIGETAFKNCTALTAIHWPAALSSVKELAFEGCAALRTVEVAEPTASSQVWERGIFKGCRALEGMVVPKNITELEQWAFLGCSSLQWVELPHGLKRIGYDAFQNAGLVSVEIPKTVTRIQNGAFEGSTLQEVTFLCSGAQLTMGTNVFADCQKLESVKLPNGTTYVEISTFEGCTSLREISFPDSLRSIGNRAFEGCTSLEILRLHSGITGISDTAFDSCPSLRVVTMEGENERFEVLNESIIIDKKDNSLFLCTTEAVLTPELGLTVIPEGVFTSRGIRSLVIPEGVTELADGAFTNCTALESIILPSTLTTIGKRAFSGCTALVSIQIPDSVTVMGESAFVNCSSLQSIRLSESLVRLERHTFSNCIALTEIHIPDSVLRLGSYLFSGCTGLERAYLSAQISAVEDYVFLDCKALTEVYLEGNVKKWEIITKDTIQDKGKYTVYCKNGMIGPDGDVTLYE